MFAFPTPLYIFPPPHVICAFLFSNMSGGGVRFFPSQKQSSSVWLSILLQCLHFSNFFSFYGWLFPTFHSMRGGTLDLLPPSPLPNPPHPTLLPGGWFTTSVISFSFYLINVCIKFSFVDTLASVCEFISWIVSQVAAAISSWCSVAFDVLPYPDCLASSFKFSYGQHTPCWIVTFPLPTFDLFQVGHANLPRPSPSLRFP